MVDLEFDGQLTVKQKGRFNLALDSLTLYTNFGFKASVTVTLCMMALALAELIYTLIIFATGHPVEGWTTTMFVITVGFAGAVRRADHRRQVSVAALKSDVQAAEISCGKH